MSRRTENAIQQARARIAGIRDAINAVDYLCSGTLLEHMTRCGKPGCRCATDPTMTGDTCRVESWSIGEFRQSKPPSCALQSQTTERSRSSYLLGRRKARNSSTLKIHETPDPEIR